MHNYLKVFMDDTVLRTSHEGIGANCRWPRPDLDNGGGALQFCGVGSLVGSIEGRTFQVPTWAAKYKKTYNLCAHIWRTEHHL